MSKKGKGGGGNITADIADSNLIPLQSNRSKNNPPSANNNPFLSNSNQQQSVFFASAISPNSSIQQQQILQPIIDYLDQFEDVVTEIQTCQQKLQVTDEAEEYQERKVKLILNILDFLCANTSVLNCTSAPQPISNSGNTVAKMSQTLEKYYFSSLALLAKQNVEIFAEKRIVQAFIHDSLTERAWVDSDLIKEFKLAILTCFHDHNVEYKSKNSDTIVRNRYGPESTIQIRDLLFSELSPSNVTKYDLKNVVRLVTDSLQFRDMRLYAAKNLENWLGNQILFKFAKDLLADLVFYVCEASQEDIQTFSVLFQLLVKLKNNNISNTIELSTQLVQNNVDLFSYFALKHLLLLETSPTRPTAVPKMFISFYKLLPSSERESRIAYIIQEMCINEANIASTVIRNTTRKVIKYLLPEGFRVFDFGTCMFGGFGFAEKLGYQKPNELKDRWIMLTSDIVIQSILLHVSCVIKPNEKKEEQPFLHMLSFFHKFCVNWVLESLPLFYGNEINPEYLYSMLQFLLFLKPNPQQVYLPLAMYQTSNPLETVGPVDLDRNQFLYWFSEIPLSDETINGLIDKGMRSGISQEMVFELCKALIKRAALFKNSNLQLYLSGNASISCFTITKAEIIYNMLRLALFNHGKIDEYVTQQLSRPRLFYRQMLWEIVYLILVLTCHCPEVLYEAVTLLPTTSMLFDILLRHQLSQQWDTLQEDAQITQEERDTVLTFVKEAHILAKETKQENNFFFKEQSSEYWLQLFGLNDFNVHIRVPPTVELRQLLVKWNEELKLGMLLRATEKPIPFLRKALEQDASNRINYMTWLLPILQIEQEIIPKLPCLITCEVLLESLQNNANNQTNLKWRERVIVHLSEGLFQRETESQQILEFFLSHLCMNRSKEAKLALQFLLQRNVTYQPDEAQDDSNPSWVTISRQNDWMNQLPQTLSWQLLLHQKRDWLWNIVLQIILHDTDIVWILTWAELCYKLSLFPHSLIDLTQILSQWITNHPQPLTRQIQNCCSSNVLQKDAIQWLIESIYVQSFSTFMTNEMQQHMLQSDCYSIRNSKSSITFIPKIILDALLLWLCIPCLQPLQHIQQSIYIPLFGNSYQEYEIFYQRNSIPALEITHAMAFLKSANIFLMKRVLPCITTLQLIELIGTFGISKLTMNMILETLVSRADIKQLLLDKTHANKEWKRKMIALAKQFENGQAFVDLLQFIQVTDEMESSSTMESMEQSVDFIPTSKSEQLLLNSLLQEQSSIQTNSHTLHEKLLEHQFNSSIIVTDPMYAPIVDSKDLILIDNQQLSNSLYKSARQVTQQSLTFDHAKSVLLQSTCQQLCDLLFVKEEYYYFWMSSMIQCWKPLPLQQIFVDMLQHLSNVSNHYTPLLICKWMETCWEQWISRNSYESTSPHLYYCKASLQMMEQMTRQLLRLSWEQLQTHSSLCQVLVHAVESNSSEPLLEQIVNQVLLPHKASMKQAQFLLEYLYLKYPLELQSILVPLSPSTLHRSTPTLQMSSINLTIPISSLDGLLRRICQQYFTNQLPFAYSLLQYLSCVHPWIVIRYLDSVCAAIHSFASLLHILLLLRPHIFDCHQVMSWLNEKIHIHMEQELTSIHGNKLQPEMMDLALQYIEWNYSHVIHHVKNNQTMLLQQSWKQVSTQGKIVLEKLSQVMPQNLKLKHLLHIFPIHGNSGVIREDYLQWIPQEEVEQESEEAHWDSIQQTNRILQEYIPLENQQYNPILISSKHHALIHKLKELDQKSLLKPSILKPHLHNLLLLTQKSFSVLYSNNIETPTTSTIESQLYHLILRYLHHDPHSHSLIVPFFIQTLRYPRKMIALQAAKFAMEILPFAIERSPEILNELHRLNDPTATTQLSTFFESLIKL